MSEFLKAWGLGGAIVVVGLVNGFAGAGALAASDPTPAIPRRGQLVLFGDSITAYGDRADGWVRILRGKFADELGRPDIRIVNAGQGGDVVQDLHRRFFWRTWRRPDVVVLCIGINDARRAAGLGYGELDLREYREGLDALVDKLQDTGALVVVASPIVSGEQMRGRNALDPIVDAYARAAGEVAESRGAPFLDLRSIFFDRLAAANLADKPSGILTYDGLHLSAAGNTLMAESVLGKLRALPPAKTMP
jgi:lysophospholipase L1-like esterase